MDKIRICALAGLDEAGRDCYIIEINDDIFVVDVGCTLADKTMPGVDYILPNCDYIIDNAHRVKAYLISHGHDENMAGLKYFYHYAPAPIYCSIATRDSMLGQALILDIKRNFDFHIVNASDSFTVAGRKIHFFQTAHNVPLSSGIAIETDRGNIVYSGDFIVDYTQKNPHYIFDFHQISIINEKPTLILLCESKGANKPGYCSPKHRITRLINSYFKEDKRIFITCFWQNIYRIGEIAELCRQYKKKVYFYDEYTRQVISLLQKTPNNNLFRPEDIIAPEDLLRIRQQDVVILILGHGRELYEECDLIAKGKNKDKRIVISSEDIFIMGALATPTLEIAVTHAVDNLYRTGAEVVWLKSKELSSMHAREDDVRALLALFKPKYYLPVRGSFVNLMANAKIALNSGIGLNHMNVFIIDNGMQVAFDSDKERPYLIPNEENGIHIDPVLVDGKAITKIGSTIMEDRRKLGIDGVVVIACAVSLAQKKIVFGPDCQMRGFVYVREAEPILKSVTNFFIDEVNNELQQDNPDFEKVKESIQERAKRFIKRENGREPYLLPIIIVND